MEARQCCWRPLKRAPRLTATEMTSLGSEEDLIILRRLEEKYSCSHFPSEIFDKTEFRFATNHTPSRTAQPGIAQEFQVKQEPITPAQSPAVSGQSTALATLSRSHGQTLKTNTQPQKQLLAGAVKIKHSPNRFTNLEGKQAKVGVTREDEGVLLLTLSQGQKRKLATCDDHKLDIASGNDCQDLHHEPNMLMPVDAKEDESSAQYSQYFFLQSASPKPRNCSAVTWPSKPSFSNVSEDWITYSPQTDSGFESTKNRNPFSPHCVQGDSVNQKFLPTTKPTTYDFPQAGFLCPTPHKEARCLTAPEVRHTSVTAPKWMQATQQTGKTSCSLPNHQKLKGATSGQSREESDTLSIVRCSRQRSSETEATPGKDKSRAAAFLVPSPMSQKMQQAEPATPRSDRRSHEHQPFMADTKFVPSSSRLDRPEISGTREDLCAAPASSDSRGKISTAPATKQTSMDTSMARIQQKLKAHPETTQTDTTVAKDRADGRMEGVDRDTDADSTMEHVHDVSTMSKEQRQQLAAGLETTGTTSCLVLYEDNTTNTDSSVLNRPKVRGLFLHFDNITYLLPAPHHCTADTLQWSRTVLDSLLKNRETLKVAVNCKHLVLALMQEFSLGDNRGTLGWQFEDPIIAGWLLSPDSPPHTLQMLCKTVGVSHEEGGRPHEDLAVAVTVMERLRSRLMTEGLWSLFHHVEMPLAPVLAVMELQPIRVNIQAFITFSDVLKKKLDRVERKAHQLAGHPFCINSTQQLRQLLYEELKLDQQLPSSRKVTLTAIAHHKSTSEPMLRQMTAAHPLPAVILEYRHLLKLKSTYIDGMLEAMDGGALHTHWDQTAAATGRLASSHPNLQAIPKTPTTITDYEDNYIVGSENKSYEIFAREPYISNEGNVFLAADFQQIELRLLAHLTNDPGLKDVFHSSNKTADIFIQLTAQWLSKPCDDVAHTEREQTKRVVYSILYGVGRDRLAEYLKVSPSRAKDIMDSFLVTFPAIQTFTRKCIDYARQYGYTESVMGRRRWFPKVHHKVAHLRAQAERQAVNFCVQGSAADLCKRAMLRVEQALSEKPHLSARLLIHIHDELVWELPENQLKETCELIRQVMEDDGLLCRPLLSSLRVPVTVSLSCGTSWAHLKPCG